jgi:hypothetical protein
VTFLVLQRPPPHKRDFDVVSVGDDLLYLVILRYDEALMDALLSRPGVRGVPVPQALDGLEAQIAGATCVRARSLVDRMDKMYLRHVPTGPQRLEELGRLVHTRCAQSSPSSPD